jgi:hypothetical protein
MVMGCRFLPAPAMPERYQFAHARARSALSIEVKDFEEEKSLDERRRGLGGCGSAGRLWQNLLF